MTAGEANEAQEKHTVALFGAGQIGEAIAIMLTSSGRYYVHIADLHEERALALAKECPEGSAQGHGLNLDDEERTLGILKKTKAVISALPFFCNVTVATMARRLNLHYFDLTEDVQVTKTIQEIAAGASTIFLPQCGLAPGFVSIAAASMMRELDEVDSVKLYVGALPRYPTNRLKYNLTWSTDGLVNEYLRPCESISGGELHLLPPLEGYERITVDGVEYEAFNTSGGLGSLCLSALGKVRSLTYKSLRYPGHRDLIQFLLQDLRLSHEPKRLVRLLDNALPRASQDACIILVEVAGRIGGELMQKTYANRILHDHHGDLPISAIQRTTASGVCVPLDLIMSEKITFPVGFAHIENINLETFLHNEFGAPYRC